jgi:hypothetical protein
MEEIRLELNKKSKIDKVHVMDLYLIDEINLVIYK